MAEAVQRLVSPAPLEQPRQPGAVTTPVSKPLPPPAVEPQARPRLSRPIMALCAVTVLGLGCFAAAKLLSE
jgi:hypothetical protein